MQNLEREGLASELASLLLKESLDSDSLIELVCQTALCSREDARDVIYDAAAQINAALFPPLTQMELVLTEGCNLACTYCFEKEMIGYRNMPFEVAKNAVDLLFLYSRNEPNIDIAYFGGEPTLRFETIKAVTEYARNRSDAAGKRIGLNITTNGVLLTDEIASYCAEQDIRILLSIDGLEVAHDRYRRDRQGRGTFTRVMEGMRILKRYQPWIGIKMTIMPENIEHLVDDVRLLHEMGVNQFIIGHVTGVDWPDNQILAYAQAMGNLDCWYRREKDQDLRIDDLEYMDSKSAYFGCQAGRSSISVSVDGQVSPCSKMLALNNRNLLGRLGDVWCGLTNLKNRADLVGCERLKGACKDKGIASDYQGGCFVSNYYETGDLLFPSMKEYQLQCIQNQCIQRAAKALDTASIFRES